MRYFPQLDAFVFDRRPAASPSPGTTAAALGPVTRHGRPPAPGPALDSTFPRFDNATAQIGNNVIGCMGWTSHYFYPGGVCVFFRGAETLRCQPLFVWKVPESFRVLRSVMTRKFEIGQST